MLRRLFCTACLLLPPGLAVAQEREWFFDVGDTEAYLVFGVPETDDAGISFWCPLRSGEIRIFLPETPKHLAAGASSAVSIRSGGETFSYSAMVETNEEAGSTSAEARTDTADTLFSMLQQEDRFTLTVGGEATVIPLAGADVAALLRVCGKP